MCKWRERITYPPERVICIFENSQMSLKGFHTLQYFCQFCITDLQFFIVYESRSNLELLISKRYTVVVRTESFP